MNSSLDKINMKLFKVNKKLAGIRLDSSPSAAKALDFILYLHKERQFCTYIILKDSSKNYHLC